MTHHPTTKRVLLAGDIGGTTSRLRLAEQSGTASRTLSERHYDSQQHAGLAEIVMAFCREASCGSIDAACFAVAGPIRHQHGQETVRVTNLPWELERGALASALNIPRVRLINDFEAVGYGIEQLADRETVVLQEGEPDLHAPRAVLGAGTGLGQALLVWEHDHYVVIPTEGGHVDFGPTDAMQVQLAEWLIAKLGRASYEDILSGSGLVRLYEFLKSHRGLPESATVAAAMQHGDAAAAVSTAAIGQGDPLARAALELFVSIYGAQAGNLALASGATAGVYVAGGIVARILDWLPREQFIAAFRNKGRMSAMLERIPLHIVASTDVGLRGALACASRMPA